jgi:hypothetical protein
VLVVHGTVTATANEFGGAVIALAALTAAGLPAGIARRRVYDQTCPTPGVA